MMYLESTEIVVTDVKNNENLVCLIPTDWSTCDPHSASNPSVFWADLQKQAHNPNYLSGCSTTTQ